MFWLSVAKSASGKNPIRDQNLFPCIRFLACFYHGRFLNGPHFSLGLLANLLTLKQLVVFGLQVIPDKFTSDHADEVNSACNIVDIIMSTDLYNVMPQTIYQDRIPTLNCVFLCMCVCAYLWPPQRQTEQCCPGPKGLWLCFPST